MPRRRHRGCIPPHILLLLLFLFLRNIPNDASTADPKDQFYADCESDTADETKFRCDVTATVSECIESDKKCNGVSECFNGWDESIATCGCPSGEFQCNRTSCIPIIQRCNGVPDCPDENDEKECETFSCIAPTYCKCKTSHRCVPCDSFCDFSLDCGEGDDTDEKTCHHRPCFPTEFTCANSECINMVYLCDGNDTCRDGSDEIGCDKHFACENGLYINRDMVCDGWVECPDSYFDEIYCGDCSSIQHRCTNGRCINAMNVCDGVCDCQDTCDDETRCETLECDPDKRHRCVLRGNAGRCITKTSLCDGINGCLDSTNGTDEKYCDRDKCLTGDIRCEDGTCVSHTQRCDREILCSTDEYQCINGQCITNDRVCDGKVDCYLGSDERNCENYTCRGGRRKCRGGHCVPQNAWCDYVRDCPDYSDEELCVRRDCTKEEFRCRNGQCIPLSQECYHDRNSAGGCKDKSHLIHCRNRTCGGNKYKCLYSYCIPQSHVCDGEPDCMLSYWDEMDHICSFPCPEPSRECSCKDELVTCRDTDLLAIPRFSKGHQFNKLFIVGNNLAGRINESSFHNMERTTLLDLTGNNITSLSPKVFVRLWRLDSLILQDNRLTHIESLTFEGLTNLTTLYLQKNLITDISPFAFSGLYNLRDLDLSRQKISLVHPNSFAGLPALLKLNLSGNSIKRINDGTFNNLRQLLELDISNNDINMIEPNVFHGLSHLRKLYTDEYRFCCLAKQVRVCTPPPNEFSSCEDLMSNTILRVSIWIIGFVAAFGNLKVIGWRLREINKTKVARVHSFLITNLAMADFLMGVYLLIIASVDSFYRGVYISHDKVWRASAMCNFCGFLSTLSSELSVFTLTTITVDRLVSIIFPFQIRRLTFRDSRIAMALMWLFVIFLAVIPLVGIPYFKAFYGRSPVCLPLHITPERPLGWEYSVFLFLGLNALSFVIIATSYITMYSTAKRSRSAVRSQESRTDNAMARRMTLIVLTDFLCWVPIIVLGVTSLAGTPIPPQVYAWIAVFVLPLNSAVNPVLYTLATTPFVSQIRRGASSLRKSWGVSVNGETRDTYAGESCTWERDVGRDYLRNKEIIRMRGMRGSDVVDERLRGNGRLQSGSEVSPEKKALRDTTDTDSDW